MHDRPDDAPGGLPDVSRTAEESLAAIRDAARRERLLDMERRLRRYRTACFAILAVGLGRAGARSSAGGGWCRCGRLRRLRRRRPLHAHQQRPPGVWIAAAWGLLPLLLAGAVVATGGAASPALMWFALPAVTLGARFEPRGIAVGTAYILVLLLAQHGRRSIPAAAAADRQSVIAAAALVLSTVVLSGALVESDRAHRRRSTLDPLTGLFNRNALDQRLAELDGQLRRRGGRRSHALLLCDLDHFKRVNDQLGHAAGDAVLQDVAYTMRAALRAGDSIYRVGGEEILVVLPGRERRTPSRSPSACGGRSASGARPACR